MLTARECESSLRLHARNVGMWTPLSYRNVAAEVNVDRGIPTYTVKLAQDTRRIIVPTWHLLLTRVSHLQINHYSRSRLHPPHILRQNTHGQPPSRPPVSIPALDPADSLAPTPPPVLKHLISPLQLGHAVKPHHMLSHVMLH